MDAGVENRLTIGATIGAVMIALLAAWCWPRGAAPELGPAAPARGWNGPIGPGVTGGAPAVVPHMAPAAGPLVADLALRKLMDSYLREGGDRRAGAAHLRAYLARKFAGQAAAEADRIAAAYLGYLETEDQLLARERFNAPAAGLAERDVERLVAWQEQRAQRRQRAFGPVLAQAWFDADNARCGAALRDWQVQHVAPDPAREPDAVELREQRLHGAVLAARRDEDAQACAAQIIGGQ